MAGPVLVPDASVLLKWVLDSDDESDRAAALTLREFWLSGGCTIAVPHLWVYEVGNILGIKRPEAAAALLESVVQLEMEQVGPEQYLSDVFRLMKKHAVTFYDAAYHALAVSRKGTLITADAAYLRKVRATGHAVLLAQWRQAAGGSGA